MSEKITKDVRTVVHFPGSQADGAGGTDMTFVLSDRSIAKFGVDDKFYKSNPDLWRRLSRGHCSVYRGEASTTAVTSTPNGPCTVDVDALHFVHGLAGMCKFGNIDDRHLSNCMLGDSSQDLEALVGRNCAGSGCVNQNGRTAGGNHSSSDESASTAATSSNPRTAWLLRKENGSCFHVTGFRVGGGERSGAGAGTFFWLLGSKNCHMLVRDGQEEMLNDIGVDTTVGWDSAAVVRDASQAVYTDTTSDNRPHPYASKRFQFARMLALVFYHTVLGYRKEGGGEAGGEAENSRRRAQLRAYLEDHPTHSFCGEACLVADPHLVTYGEEQGPGGREEDSEEVAVGSGGSTVGADAIRFFAVTERGYMAAGATPEAVRSGVADERGVRGLVALNPTEAVALFRALGLLTVLRIEQVQVSLPADTPSSAASICHGEEAWVAAAASFEFEDNSEGAVVYFSGCGDAKGTVERVFKYKNVYYVVDRALREQLKKGKFYDEGEGAGTSAGGSAVGRVVLPGSAEARLEAALVVEGIRKRFQRFHFPVELYCRGSWGGSSASASDSAGSDRSHTCGLGFYEFVTAFVHFVHAKILRGRASGGIAGDAGGGGGVALTGWMDAGGQFVALRKEFVTTRTAEQMRAMARMQRDVGGESEAEMTGSQEGSANKVETGLTGLTELTVTVPPADLGALPLPTPPTGVSVPCAPRDPGEQSIIIPTSVPGVGKSTLLRSLHRLVGGVYANQDELNGSKGPFLRAAVEHAGRKWGSSGGASTALGERSAAGAEEEGSDSVPAFLFLDKCHQDARTRGETVAALRSKLDTLAVGGTDTSTGFVPSTPNIIALQLLHGRDVEQLYPGVAVQPRGLTGVPCRGGEAHNSDNGGEREEDEDGERNHGVPATATLALDRIRSRGTHHPSLVYDGNEEDAGAEDPEVACSGRSCRRSPYEATVHYMASAYQPLPLPLSDACWYRRAVTVDAQEKDIEAMVCACLSELLLPAEQSGRFVCIRTGVAATNQAEEEEDHARKLLLELSAVHRRAATVAEQEQLATELSGPVRLNDHSRDTAAALARWEASSTSSRQTAVDLLRSVVHSAVEVVLQQEQACEGPVANKRGGGKPKKVKPVAKADKKQQQTLAPHFAAVFFDSIEADTAIRSAVLAAIDSSSESGSVEGAVSEPDGPRPLSYRCVAEPVPAQGASITLVPTPGIKPAGFHCTLRHFRDNGDKGGGGGSSCSIDASAAASPPSSPDESLGAGAGVDAEDPLVAPGAVGVSGAQALEQLQPLTGWRCTVVASEVCWDGRVIALPVSITALRPPPSASGGDEDALPLSALHSYNRYPHVTYATAPYTCKSRKGSPGSPHTGDPSDETPAGKARYARPWLSNPMLARRFGVSTTSATSTCDGDGSVVGTDASTEDSALCRTISVPLAKPLTLCGTIQIVYSA